MATLLLKARQVLPHFCSIGKTHVLIQRCGYAKMGKLAKGMAAMPTRTYLEVETDPHKLCNFVCGANIYKDGQDPEVKEDSEYPDWLWELRMERGSPPLETLDKDTWEYWRKIRKQTWKSNRQTSKMQHRYKRFP